MSNRRSLAHRPFVCGWRVAALFPASSAWAQLTTFTTSTSCTDSFSDTRLPSIRTDTYRTRLLGLLQGDPMLYFDQTYATAIDGPSLDGSVESLLSSNEVYTLLGDPQEIESFQMEETIGGNTGGLGFDTILVGNRGLCAGFNDQGFVFGCSGGDPFNVLAGTNNMNINENLECVFTRTIQRTDTDEIFDTWRLIGVPVGWQARQGLFTLPVCGHGRRL